jgi:phage baseplate assembly protein W
VNRKNLIGRGWRFPVKPDPGGRLRYLGGNGNDDRRFSPDEDAERIRQSLWLLLSTAPGERLMLPDFGCGIHDLVFEPNSAALRGTLQVKVLETLQRWEPRIDVLDVQVESPPEQRNLLNIRIDYRIRTDNSFYNLVYPFFLDEGAG